MTTDLQIGPWKGYWYQASVPEPHMMQLRVTQASGTFEASGEDKVGSFTLTGSPKGDSHHWSMTKQYLGRHQVFYEVRRVAEGFAGSWSVQDVRLGGCVLWPGPSEGPSRELLDAIPKIDLVSGSTIRALRVLDWMFLCIGSIGLTVGVTLAESRRSAALVMAAFVAYMLATDQVHRRLVLRYIRRVLPGAGNLRSVRATTWKPKGVGQYSAVLVLYGAICYAIWQLYRK